MINYTKDEWRLDTTDAGNVIVRIGNGGAHDIDIVNMEFACPECLGNAKLIAAAPKMFELLKEQLDATNNFPMSDMNYSGIDWMFKAKNVLADLLK